MDSACVNERGFAVSGTVTAHSTDKIRKVDPFVKDGAGEDSLPGLLALCCSTVQEALKLIGDVIASRGHNNGEIYMIADKDEAWYVEVYSGHQWAAVKMPEDKVACWGNQFMIRSFNPDSPDTRHSKDLLKVAKEAGTFVRGEDGLPDLFRCYAVPLRDYSNYRTWFGHKTLAPETAGEYAENRPMPLFYTPAHKVSYRDMFELMRTRYEGTDRNPEANNRQDVRVIGTTKQASSHVISLDSRLPAPLRGTIWASLANCEHSVFMPLNASIARCDEAYSLDQTDGAFRYDMRFAGNAFRRLCALAEQNRKWYGVGVRAFWREREDFYLGRYPKLLANAAEKWNVDPAAAVEMLTSFAIKSQRKDFADAKRIFDELMWYVMGNNRIEGDGSGATSEPKSPFAVSEIQMKGKRSAANVPFPRYRFDAGKDAPILFYDAYRPIESGSQAEVAIVLIHGWGGHVRTLLPIFTKALSVRAGSEARTPYVIAPQFPRRKTMVSNKEPEDGRAIWCDSWSNEKAHPDRMGRAADDWRGGGDANGTSFSSYDYIDAIFAKFADRTKYPNLRKVVLAGFSAGGQFAGRYAATGKGVVRDGVKVVYIAMAPSTEFRFDPDQPWHYGLKGRPRYSAALTDEEIMKNLCSRRVWRGCGSRDVLGRPKTSLDITPPAVAQGANRYERFMNFKSYLDKYPEWKKQVTFHVFEGVAHTEDICYPDTALLDFVFE